MNAPITSTLALRASAMPLAMLCPGSARPAELRINSTNDAAATGTAAHKMFEGLVTTGAIDWERINEVCDELGGDSEEVRMLCAKATRMWPKVRDSFPAALTEIAVDKYLEIEGVRITGHIDLLSVFGDMVREADWKTGRKDANYSHQLKAYLSMTLLAYPQLASGTATILWVRDGEIENYHMTQADAEAWLADVVKRVVHWDGTYHPGSHCQYCPRFHECPAANALTRTYVASLAEIDVDQVAATLAKMEPNSVIELYRKAKVVAGISDKVLTAIKAQASEMPIDDGETVLRVVTEGRRELDPEKAWPVLENAGFGDADFAACMRLSISKVEKRVAENAGKGAGAAAKRALAQKLELAGAIELNEIHKLEIKRSA